MPHTQQIQSFLDFLKYQKRYSKNTIVSYETDLTVFFDFIQLAFNENELLKIEPTFIRSWLASLKEKGMSSKSINRKISSLKSFFKYQLKEGVISISPMGTIISPKVSKRLPQYVEKEHIETLFHAVEFPDNWKGKTERLVLELLYNTGMRQAELIGLKEHNIDLANSALKVLGKGNKERVIPISNSLKNTLQLYILAKKSAFDEVEKGYLLINENGRKLYPKYVYLLVKKYLGFVTTIDKKSPHILRHTFATHLSNSGADLNAIKELLGHSSLAATQVYTHNNIEKLKDIHSKAHPKA